MLSLVTDQRPGEPELLAKVKHQPFEIRSLAGNVLTTVTAPVAGWTYEQLVDVAMQHEAITHDGADGYLGTQWVGSTEI